MGKDRQEKKLRESESVPADRDQDIHKQGAAKLEGPEDARKRNKG